VLGARFYFLGHSALVILKYVLMKLKMLNYRCKLSLQSRLKIFDIPNWNHSTLFYHPNLLFIGSWEHHSQELR
jgi:hypothetical protein